MSCLNKYGSRLMPRANRQMTKKQTGIIAFMTIKGVSGSNE